MGLKKYMKNHSYIITPHQPYPVPWTAVTNHQRWPIQGKQGTLARIGVRARRLAFSCEPGPPPGAGGNPIQLGPLNQGGLIEYINESNAPETYARIRPWLIFRRVFLRPDRQWPAGFSLLECLVSLSLSLLILVSALELAVQSRRVFLKLRESQEKNLAVVVALEKMREDLETAGAGIPALLSGGGLTPLQVNGQTLVIFSAEGKTTLLADVSPGQSYLLLKLNPGLTSMLKKGRAVYLVDGASGELVYINSVSGNALTVSAPLAAAFEVARTEVIILEKIELYLDRQQKILRRRVNNTTGQPLLEEAEDFTALYQAENNLASIILSIESGGKAHEYELVIYPKNLGHL